MAEPDEDSDGSEEGGASRGAVIALLVIVALVAGGLFLTHELRGAATIQDCVASGRTNCAPIGH